MRIPEVKTTYKKVLSLNDIKGVDLTSAPLHVKSTRASYMKNMICKGGVNHKRNGFEQVAHIQDNGKGVKIHSMVSLSNVNDGHTNEDSIFTYAGNKLFFSDGKFMEILECAELAPKNNKVKMFYYDDLWVLVNDKLCKYDGFETIESLFGSKGAYVPTTSIGITDELHGGKAETFEAVNLFSTKRVNKLVGFKNATKKTINGDESNEYETLKGSEAVFFLDGKIDLEKEIKITTKVNISQDESNNTLDLIGYVMNSEEKTDFYYEECITTIFSFKGEKEKETVEINGDSTFTKGGEEKAVYKFEELGPENNDRFVGSFKVRIENDENGRGKLTFSPALPSYIEGEDNITVEYSVAKEAPVIKEACELNIGGSTKMLAIVTKDDIVYFSSPSEGYSYFPDNSYVKAQSGVSALIPGNGFLGIASDNEITNVSLTFDTSRDRLLLVPKLTAKINDVGCVSPLSVASLEGDVLFLSRKGVYGLTESGVHLRSSNINGEILSPTLQNDKAHAVVRNGQYYLFIDGNVYIADARYKTYESQRLDVSYEYEWWRWDNCPMVSAIIHDGEMYLGRGDGRIMKLGKGYSDITKYKLIEGEPITTDGKEFTFNKELGIKAGDKIKIDNAYIKLAKVAFRYDHEEKKAHLEFEQDIFFEMLSKGKLVKGKTFFVKVVAPVEQAEINDFEINQNEMKMSFSFESEKNNTYTTEAFLYSVIENENFDVKLVGDSNYNLIDDYGETVELSVYDDAKFTLVNINPVEAEMHSAVISLGSGASKSTLHKLIFTPSRETSGEVHVGYETNKADKFKSQVVGSGFDFSALDFYNFSFDADFYRRYEKRLHERNVEFVKFKFKSVSSGDFAIEAFDLIYSENGR